MIIIKRIIKKQGARIWIGFIWLRTSPQSTFPSTQGNQAKQVGIWLKIYNYFVIDVQSNTILSHPNFQVANLDGYKIQNFVLFVAHRLLCNAVNINNKTENCNECLQTTEMGWDPSCQRLKFLEVSQFPSLEEVVFLHCLMLLFSVPF
jgi:hypothetical protein